MKLQHRPLVATALLAGIASIAAGCGQKTIVGKWAGVAKGPGGLSANVAAEFKSDGTETMTLGVMGRSLTQTNNYKADNGTLTVITHSSISDKEVTQSFPYKLDGDTLTMNSPYDPTPIVLKRQP